MPKGKAQYRAAKHHHPKKSLGYNWLIAAKGFFRAVPQKPHIASAMAYAEATQELRIYGQTLSEPRRLVREANIKRIGEAAAEYMLDALQSGDSQLFQDLSELTKYLHREKHLVDPVRCSMIEYCMRNGYDDGWRPTTSELAALLDCEDRQVRRMAIEIGIKFRGSPDT